MGAAMNGIDFKAIAQALLARAPGILIEWLPNAHREGQECRAANVIGDPGKSFGVNCETGVWRDFNSPEKGGADLIALFARINNLTMAQAARELVHRYGLAAATINGNGNHNGAARQPSNQYSESAKEIWRKSGPVRTEGKGTVGRYLVSRGITIAPPDSIRACYNCWHSPTHTVWAGMIAGVSNPAGEIVAIQRTFLTGYGRKAPVAPVKMSLGPIKGNAIRLAAAGERLVIAEGVETGLSVLQPTGVPTWVTTGAEFYKDVWVPDFVREVIFAIDLDDNGASERAAREATGRLQGEGRKVRIMRPKPGSDFNDYLRGRDERR
jgi:hypothetical protein